MRRPYAFVAILYAHREGDRILHAVAAPGGADAALDGTQRLAVGVAALEARVHKLLPDVRQVLQLGAEQIDALAAGDLGVEAVVPCRLAQGDELVGGNLAARHARNHRVQPAALHVGEEAVVGVLQGVVRRVADRLVPQRRQDGSDGRLAHLAAGAAAVLADDLVERLQLLGLDDGEQLDARIREVLAHMMADSDAGRGHGAVKQVGDQGHAAAAAGAGPGGGFEIRQGGDVLLAHGVADGALGDVVTGADLRRIGHRVDADQRPGAARAAQDQRVGAARQRLAALGQHGQGAVVAGVADQHAAEQPGAVGAEQQLLVDAVEGVFPGQRMGGFGTGFVVAEAGDVHAHELQLGGQVGALEAGVAAGEVGGDDLSHLVARRHQAVDHAAVQGHFTDGVDGRVGGLQQVVDRHAAALADLNAAGARQIVARPNAGRHDNHVHVQHVAVLKAHAGHAAVAEHLLGGFVEVHADAEVFNLAHQDARAGVVDLPRHQARGEFHHVRLQAEVVRRLGRLEAEQAAADDGGALHPVAVVDNSLQVLGYGRQTRRAFRCQAAAARTGRTPWPAPPCRSSPRRPCRSAPPWLGGRCRWRGRRRAVPRRWLRTRPFWPS